MNSRNVLTFVVAVGLGGVGCTQEVAPPSEGTATTSEAIGSPENDAPDFQLSMVGIMYINSKAYKSVQVTTPFMSQASSTSVMSDWTKWASAYLPATADGIRLGVITTQSNGALHTILDFQICIQAGYQEVNGNIDEQGPIECTPWASQIGGSCPRQAVGVGGGCTASAFSAEAGLNFPGQPYVMPNVYRIGYNKRYWGTTPNRELYNFSLGAMATGIDPNANCNSSLYGCVRSGAVVWTPDTSAGGGWTSTVTYPNDGQIGPNYCSSFGNECIAASPFAMSVELSVDYADIE